MARVELIVRGALGRMSWDSYLISLRESLGILRSLDKAISETRTGTLHWVITGVREGSAGLEVESVVVRGQKDFGRDVAQRFTQGINIIMSEGKTPPLFTIENMNSLLKIMQAFQRDGASGLGVAVKDTDIEAELSTKAEGNTRALVGVHHKSVGSIEGKIELVSLHRPYRRFNIYHARTQKAIRCSLPELLEADVIQAMKDRRRVIVSGTIAYNIKGEPLSVQVERKFRLLGTEEELPTLDETLGIAPDLTGDLSTEQFLQSIRNA